MLRAFALIACVACGSISFWARAAPSEALLGKLKRDVSIDAQDTPLQAALERLAAASGIPLAVDWAQLKADNGLEPSTPVNLKLQEVRLPALLRLLALRLGPADNPLRAVLEDKGLRLAAESRWRSDPPQRTYDLRRLHQDWARRRPSGTARSDEEAAFTLLVSRLVRLHADRGWLGAPPDKGPTLAVDPSGPSLTLTATTPTHDRLSELLAELQAVGKGAVPRLDPRVEGADKRVAARLVELVPARFKHKPLSQALAELQQSTRENWFIDWRALQSIGITPERPVELDVPQIPADQAILVLVDELAIQPKSKGGRLPVVWGIEDGVLILSTFDAYARLGARRYHPVAAIARAPNPLVAARSALDATTAVAGPPQAWAKSPDDPAPWAIDEFAGVLVTHTTATRHRQVEAVLRRQLFR
jgi:hypothetical protein